MTKILIIEDDPAILRGLQEGLSEERMTILTAADGEQGFRSAMREQLDLIILDLMLPSKNGIDICRDLRTKGNHTPILMLTSKKHEADKVLGLEIGADDYMTKPFGIRELIARIHVLLRRKQNIDGSLQSAQFGEISVDFVKQELFKGKKAVKLSAKEFELLRYFVEHHGNVISRDQLLDDIWGYDVTPTTRTVDNYILSLRKKIERDPSNPKHLITIHTAGYKFLK
ncbi:MAG: response regulator transcription factor [Bacteroidota bacterium]